MNANKAYARAASIFMTTSVNDYNNSSTTDERHHRKGVQRWKIKPKAIK